MNDTMRKRLDDVTVPWRVITPILLAALIGMSGYFFARLQTSVDNLASEFRAEVEELEKDISENKANIKANETAIRIYHHNGRGASSP